MYEDNAFVTLTFRNEDLPDDRSVQKHHLQNFIKRLRKAHDGRTIRYFACGEYGAVHSRPHYHALLFNIDFRDKRQHALRNGNITYRSEELERLWPSGS